MVADDVKLVAKAELLAGMVAGGEATNTEADDAPNGNGCG